MASEEDISPLPDLSKISAFLQDIEQNPAAQTGLQDISFEKALRYVPEKRAVLTGQFRGAAAVFRFHLNPDSDMCQREWEELKRTSAYMTSGAYRVNRPLHHDPALRMLAVEHVSGTTLAHGISKADPATRTELIRQSARWLQHYTHVTQKRQPAKTNRWLDRANTALQNQPFPRIRRAKAEILENLSRLRPALHRYDWRVAVCHGDFHPNNILHEAGVFTGVDTGGSARLPIYKDMARFLAYVTRKNGHQTTDQTFGVDTDAFDAFVTAFNLDETERNQCLPFMIGIEALIRVEENRTHPKAHIRQHLRFYHSLLDDLRKL